MVTHVNSPDVSAGVVFYGINVLLASLMLSLLLFYVAREPGLAVDGIAEQRIKRMYVQRWMVIGVNLFALAMALVAPLIAVGLYLVTTVLFLAMPLLGFGQHWRKSGSA
jgi:hypothetical protein